MALSVRTTKAPTQDYTSQGRRHQHESGGAHIYGQMFREHNNSDYSIHRPT